MTGAAFLALLSAVCWTESHHNPAAIHIDDGGSASIGYCQIKLKTARWLGYTGNARGLLDQKTNLKWAGVYLRRQLARYHGDVKKAVSAYNAGHAAGNTTYVNRVFKALKEGK